MEIKDLVRKKDAAIRGLLSEIKERDQTIEKLRAALEFTIRCTEQLGWVKDGPGDITNPMFLGTGSVDGDQKVHEQYLEAKAALEETK